MTEPIVLISIHSKWVYKILTGSKTGELRKNFPNLPTPFRVLIYCTKKTPLWMNKDGTVLRDEEYNRLVDEMPDFLLSGKIVGEFICNEITEIKPSTIRGFYAQTVSKKSAEYTAFKKTCVPAVDAIAYAEGSKAVYVWHIEQLKKYSVPKTLSDYRKFSSNTPLTAAPQNYCLVTPA